MRSVSNLYNTLRAQDGSTYEVQVVCGNTAYGMDKLLSCTIKHALFSKDPPNIGGTVSAQCEVAMLESADNWPRMAEFEVRVRLVSADKSQQSEWLTLGTFYTDERSERSGVLSIVGLDAMMKLETGWIGLIPEEQLPASWPITARAAASLISTYGGVQIASASLSALDNSVAFIGLDETLTARDVIASIGSAMGGNWRIAPDGYLTFEPLAYTGITPGSAAIAGIAIAGITIVGDATPNTPGGDETSDYIYLSESQFASLTVGKPMPQIQGVKLKTQSGTEAAAGTEYYLSALCDFSDSGAAALALSKVRGYIYKPFTVRNCKLDPAAEIGDVAYIGKENYQIISAEWTLGAHIFCNLSAPTVNEVDHEYAVQSETTKALRKAQEEIAKTDEELRSVIVQTAAGIRTEVSQTYTTKTELTQAVGEIGGDISELQGDISDLGDDVSALDTKITTTETTLTSYIDQKADGITASVSATYQTKTDAGAESTRLEGLIQVNADAITLKVSADGVISAINQTSEQIKIQASKVNLSGYVTITALGTAGGTTINGANITTGTLDASKITTGTMSADRISGGTINANTITVTNLNASNITSGTVGSSHIPNLSANKITTDTLGTARIPDLDASKTTTGTFAVARIPDLSADKITAGTLDAKKVTIKNLSAGSITTGSLSATLISGGTLNCSNITVTNLSASSITSGTLNAANVTITNLTVTRLYFASNSTYYANKTFLFADGTRKNVYLGSDASTYNVDRVYIHSQNGVTIRQRGSDLYGLEINTSTRTILPTYDKAWNLGSSAKQFANLYLWNVGYVRALSGVSSIGASSDAGLEIGTSNTQKIGFWGKTPVAKGSVTGSTVEATLASLLNLLRSYGLISG